MGRVPTTRPGGAGVCEAGNSVQSIFASCLDGEGPRTDLAGAIGTPVHAAADGTVSRADWFSSYGLYVSLEHGGTLQTRYGHMSRLNVAAGQHVHKGDVIGYIGTTGRSTGPHLHYEVRIAGEAVNPVPYLQAGAYQLALASADPSLGKGGE